ncbi:RarD protein [Tumebacillus sp. BK434]|uniref:DMT family transporter n=1 Tax=Tumebacillus sp. BK434 TaxID=2512169 RepID=UPI0010481385|nr:DMT family transporter [Tumebacillus sp. BK434]TCP54700.1 RarD protein [Tumebacillus sp. BK434]
MGYVFVVAAMLIWGSVGIFGRWADQPATVIVLYRVLSACVVLGLYQAVRGGGLKRAWQEAAGQYAWVMFGGVVLALNWIFFFQAVQMTSLANAVLSYYVAPVLVTLLAPVLLKEKLERRTLLFVGMAFLGTLIMNPLGEVGGDHLLGMLSGLTAAFFYAMVTISGKKVTGMQAHTLVLWQTGTATLVLLPYVLWQGMAMPSLPSLGVMVTIGLVHTALALTLYFLGLNRVKVQHVGVLGYLDPVSAILFAYLFFGEAPSMETWIGGILILVSSYLILRSKETGGHLDGSRTEAQNATD